MCSLKIYIPIILLLVSWRLCGNHSIFLVESNRCRRIYWIILCSILNGFTLWRVRLNLINIICLSTNIIFTNFYVLYIEQHHNMSKPTYSLNSRSYFLKILKLIVSQNQDNVFILSFVVCICCELDSSFLLMLDLCYMKHLNDLI